MPSPDLTTTTRTFFSFPPHVKSASIRVESTAPASSHSTTNWCSSPSVMPRLSAAAQSIVVLVVTAPPVGLCRRRYRPRAAPTGLEAGPFDHHVDTRQHRQADGRRVPW